MARYYQTDKPVFVEDFIYSPDYEMAAKALLTKEKELQIQEALADQIYNIDFKYLNTDEEKLNADKIKNYFQTKADDLIHRMQSDPNNFQKYNQELKALQREYTHSKTNGAISKLEGSYNAYQSWDKVNEEICKEQPALCTALKNEAWKNWGGNSLNRQWNQERALKGIDYKAMEEVIQKLEADIISNSTLTNEGYIYRMDGKEHKFLSRPDIRNYAINTVLSRPEYLASMRQSDRVGLSRYFDKNGRLITDSSGTLGTLLNALESYAYDQTKTKLDIQNNEAALENLKQSNRKDLEKYKKSLEETPVSFTQQLQTIKLFPTATLEGRKEEFNKMINKSPESRTAEENMVIDEINGQAVNTIAKNGGLRINNVTKAFGINEKDYDKYLKINSKTENNKTREDRDFIESFDKKLNNLSKAYSRVSGDTIKTPEGKEIKLQEKSGTKAIRDGLAVTYVDNIVTYNPFDTNQYQNAVEDAQNDLLQTDIYDNMGGVIHFITPDQKSKAVQDIFNILRGGQVNMLNSQTATKDAQGNYNYDKNAFGDLQKSSGSWLIPDTDITNIGQIIQLIPQDHKIEDYITIQAVPGENRYRAVINKEIKGLDRDLKPYYDFTIPNSVSTITNDYDNKYNNEVANLATPEQWMTMVKSNATFNNQSQQLASRFYALEHSKYNKNTSYQLPGVPDVTVNLEKKNLKDSDGNIVREYQVYTLEYKDSKGNNVRTEPRVIDNTTNASLDIYMRVNGLTPKEVENNQRFKTNNNE